MLDVHAPEHRIGGFRDFLLHLFTITVGLLIALGLENAAEALHHHRQRDEIRATLRAELADNQAEMRRILASGIATRNNMIRVLGYLQARRDSKPTNPSGISLEFSEGPLQSTGWKTAVATGTLSYMDPAEVGRFAGAYAEQQLFEDTETRALEHVERLQSYIAGVKTPADLALQDLIDAIPDVRSVIADLTAMQDIGRGTLPKYAEALK